MSVKRQKKKSPNKLYTTSTSYTCKNCFPSWAIAHKSWPSCLPELLPSRQAPHSPLQTSYHHATVHYFPVLQILVGYQPWFYIYCCANKRPSIWKDLRAPMRNTLLPVIFSIWDWLNHFPQHCCTDRCSIINKQHALLHKFCFVSLTDLVISSTDRDFIKQTNQANLFFSLQIMVQSLFFLPLLTEFLTKFFFQ